MEKSQILVIKHGALGDVVLATAGFSAIRKQHPEAHITCLTSRAFAELLRASPYFDEVLVDPKPRPLNRKGISYVRMLLNSRPWDWVYDLQTSTRSTAYQWLLKRPWPSLSNVSRWASHGYTDPARHTRHALENLEYQLALAGIEKVGMPDVSWLAEDVADVKPRGAYALLVAGGASHRSEKRWPAEQYASLAQELLARKITPLLIGTKAEEEAIASIAARVPEAVNLCGKTSLAMLASLARDAVVAVGNDTGPMHLVAASGCPSVVLFSAASDPERSAPVGPKVKCMRARDLRDLPVDRVLVAVNNFAAHPVNRPLHKAMETSVA